MELDFQYISLFTGAFFSQDVAGNVLFLIYISGAILGLIMAKLLRVWYLKEKDEPFVMEDAKYRFPSFNLIFPYQFIIMQGLC